MIPPMGSQSGGGDASSGITTGTRVVFLAIALAALGLLWGGGLFRPDIWFSDPGNSTRLVPGIVLCLAVAGALWLAVFGDGQGLQDWDRGEVFRALCLAAAVLLYVRLFGVLGWAASSAVLLVSLPLALGYRSALGILLFAAPLMAVIWALFVLVMEVPLPGGTLFR